MHSIADALVYAVIYIDSRDDPTEEHVDDDVSALESIAGFLAEATEDEKDALAAAAQRAMEAAKAWPPHAPLVEQYAMWMENMFGDAWIGNRRATNG
jgi:hypothetical protein